MDSYQFASHKKSVDYRWIFKIKENLGGSLQKHKARLVDKRYHQEHELDFNETFSPVIKPTTIRLILTLSITYK